MNIQIICVGKLKEKYWDDAVNEYLKRLKRFAQVSIVELKESKLPEGMDQQIMKEEGESILKKIKDKDYVITLEIKGKNLSSEELAEKFKDLALEGKTDVDLVIGGSYGLSKEVSDRANFKLSFSKMTFPHQMMRVILLEQVYRSFKIINNETYHK
ncbi:MAG: 23S rRNA (pseudouridine(1915)-N(3))-methyltransferase RlmH [Clostridia bacterium]|nr:23S rRNA (pseudouridine(1915)-N(3))-methyltransferase RlmH [Clostridia bacterium]